MNQSSKPNSEPRAADGQAPVIAPNLSAELRENYERLQEDLRQAHELAANLESQLAGKSKEVLHLKFLFQQTKTHLGHMQDSIIAMRKERHKLANEAMRAMRLDVTIGLVTVERDRLKHELGAVCESLVAEQAKKAPPRDKRDDRIAELTFELMKLRQKLAELRDAAPTATKAANEVPPITLPEKSSGRDVAYDASELEIFPTEPTPLRRAKA